MVGFTKESKSFPARPYSPQPLYAPHNRSPTRRWQLSSSPTYSDSEEDLIEYSRPTVTRQDSKPTVGQRKLVSRPSRTHLEQDDRSLISQSSSSRSSHLSGGWGDVIKLIKNDMSEQGYLSHSSEDDLFEPVYKLEKILRQKQQVSGTRLSRHSSVREDHSRTWQGDGCVRRESFRERHVHFPDERRSNHGNSCRTNENGYSNTMERVPCPTGILRDDPTDLRETQGHQTQAQGFQRNISMRRSYHGNVRRTSVREGSRTCSVDDSNLARARLSINAPSLQTRAPQLMEVEVEDRLREMMRVRNTRQRARSLAEGERRIDRDHRHGERRVRRSQSERWQTFEEERSSTEEEMERERRMQRLPSSGAGNLSLSSAVRLSLSLHLLNAFQSVNKSSCASLHPSGVQFRSGDHFFVWSAFSQAWHLLQISSSFLKMLLSLLQQHQLFSLFQYLIVTYAWIFLHFFLIWLLLCLLWCMFPGI